MRSLNTMRCFIAIDIPEELKRLLSQIPKLDLASAKITWVNPDNIHVTLKFLGEIDEIKLKKVSESLSKISTQRFTLKTSNMGCFPNENHPAVLWLGIQESKFLLDVQKKIEGALNQLFPPEKKFVSHLTVGRIKFINDKNALQQYMKNLYVKECAFEVNEIILYRSDLTPQGPKYTILQKFEMN